MSVIVPLRDDAATLGEALSALERQTYCGSYEVLIADNGSRDAGPEVAGRWLRRTGLGRLIDASEYPGAAHARNRAAVQARGDFLAFTDADDLADPRWLAALVAAGGRGEVVAGRRVLDGLNEGVSATALELPPVDGPPVALRFLPFAHAGNCGLTPDLFRQLGGFDERLRAGEDIDLSWRAQLAGHRITFAEAAVVQYRLRPGAGALARQQYRWGRAGAQLYARFRARGMPPVSPLLALRRGAVIRRAPRRTTGARRRALVAATAYRCGRMAGCLEHRVLYP